MGEQAEGREHPGCRGLPCMQRANSGGARWQGGHLVGVRPAPGGIGATRQARRGRSTALRAAPTAVATAALTPTTRRRRWIYRLQACAMADIEANAEAVGIAAVAGGYGSLCRPAFAPDAARGMAQQRRATAAQVPAAGLAASNRGNDDRSAGSPSRPRGGNAGHCGSRLRRQLRCEPMVMETIGKNPRLLQSFPARAEGGVCNDGRSGRTRTGDP